MFSHSWHVRLGEGGRRMTDSQVEAAVARCWIDETTDVRKPGAASWGKLADVVPTKKRRITEEPVIVGDDVAASPPADLETSAMVVLSGEFEIISEAPPMKA